jgi:hypothetical protein
VVAFSDQGCCAPCADPTFNVLLKQGTKLGGVVSFNAPNDVLAFIGVWSETPFTRAEIRETTKTVDNEYCGEVFTGTDEAPHGQHPSRAQEARVQGERQRQGRRVLGRHAPRGGWSWAALVAAGQAAAPSAPRALLLGKAAVVRLPVPALPLVFGRTILHTHEQYEAMAEVERRADRCSAIYGPRAK